MQKCFVVTIWAILRIANTITDVETELCAMVGRVFARAVVKMTSRPTFCALHPINAGKRGLREQRFLYRMP